ncbi:MAG: cysteine--tRNA ligase [Candidatus Taylorbacteria bacterium RIFCSPLOWO2_12_FULL_43_20]|uniref:Cysteine--tRNA ligase n=1 Tax=Candidatus Taylorbacteria bacterium RIFCSPLOWO2_12_FULL_43_20 TaxID=1802332 RepID=A0A1G2P4U3_9BACT|nr:MAG: cysteine--tRNA ligase [Candidatus Taylorbacteria bacterium RIFCSPHIGHO2_01_FULL_43_120]OHA22949.1 MAG: cysteine--tRNA ligase [Candidatus Taylorbacteria bacterium RIFCSPHIGHO2_02_FULL_43_55]OHA30188.1 MAG: cysteine--tRNA ligase [Candidatus Taylorbacteria bacterium RIFCSPHIGHO2_12_FULL_42_34]OHA31935.1 MAG: cysteine--tRNA ligase [Candidatus Taylorbacteria bacterium RIFCSPLOWO2_01_FULL_43_83]OHA37958.1 MAG: cysteine--tRNA ligase [Candidatus Taylorbacteria bacterium RIFCSPLOWO2_02_FULL_43_2
MKLILRNTLSGRKEEFKPITAGKATMYNCGPTVYFYAHIGNLRAYLFVDILKKVLQWNRYEVKQGMNITDVGHLSSDSDEGEDKMTKALKREGKPLTMEAMKEVATFYEKAFIADIQAMNIEKPELLPRASDNIAADIALIKKLEENGYTYIISSGVYFDTSKFPEYGKLGGINLEGLKEGARVNINPEKKNPADFNLWKLDDKLGWESPWGKGFPGWHIECSAMSAKYLGQPFDIHTGGVDHIGTHHNNEIAQSESAFGMPLAHYWLHNEHLNLSGVKMAKSDKDNFITLHTVVDKGFSPLDYRYYLLGAHYRSPMTFSWEALESARNARRRLLDLLSGKNDAGKINADYLEHFTSAVNDDLNTPEALAVLWNLLRDERIEIDDKKTTAFEFDKILGLKLEESIRAISEEVMPASITGLVIKREEAREQNNWIESDRLRDEINKLGYEIKDTNSGPKLKKIM